MANNISDSLSDEQIISLLQMLFTNMNNLDKLYYDMFINTTPLMLTLERYNEDGVIETYEIPNRAKDRMNITQGRGEPERSQIAGVGTLYLDVLTSNIWIKTTDSGATGWVMLYTPANFLKGREYMAPDGDASGLTGLSASNLEGGIMDVRVGGTGNQGLTGIIKGRGSDLPYTTATAGVDYLAPSSFIGTIGIFIVKDASALPNGWLLCNGSTPNKRDYPDLYEKLKDVWPNNALRTDDVTPYYIDEHGVKHSISNEVFVLPNFTNYYIKGWDGVSSVGTHKDGSIPNIKGTFFNTQEMETALPKDPTGVFRRIQSSGNGVDGTKGWFETMQFSANFYRPTIGGRTYDSVYSDNAYEINTNHITTMFAIFTGVNTKGGQ